MREIEEKKIVEEVARLSIEANCILGEDVKRAISSAMEKEESPLGREILETILANVEVGKKNNLAICQDTGITVVFVELGSEVCLKGSLEDAINEGVRRGYKEGYLRKSVVSCPLRRKNTGDNTPAIIYTSIVSGDRLKITVMPKGGGSENMSGVAMLTPAAGVEGVKRFVIERVEKSGANPCPPIIVGVGIGGTMERACLEAKRALLREIGSSHPDPFYDALEKELLEKINDLGIGPQGFGGRTTALAVFISAFPCHIASMPVAVNIQCHAARHKTVVL